MHIGGAAEPLVRGHALAVQENVPTIRFEQSYSDDGGKTWTEGHERLQKNKELLIRWRALREAATEAANSAPANEGGAYVLQKEGKRGGRMTFVIGETEFKNQRGEIVAYLRNTAIETADAVKG